MVHFFFREDSKYSGEEFPPGFLRIKQFYCGDTNGVYDESGATIEVITPKSFKKIRREISGSRAADVTGGMLHKVEEAVKAAEDFGIDTLIFSGRIKGQLKRALMGDHVNGTRIAAG